VSYMLTQLPGALSQGVVLDITSDGTTSQAVSASTSYTKPPSDPLAPQPKTPVAIAPTPSVPTTLIDVLQTLGTAMLPPLHVQQGLAHWHWSLVRYGYLLDRAPTTGALATNALAGDYRHHHMTALSEAIGVGCALSYAVEWLREASNGAIVHTPIDFDYLLGGGVPQLAGPAGQLNVAHAAHTSRHPDYLLAAEQNGQVRLLIVECKGNSAAGQSKSLDQLGSAMHQLEGVEFGGGPGTPPGVDKHAYATRMTKVGGPVEIIGIDPPDSKERWVRPVVPSREDRRPIGEHLEGGRLLLPPVDEVGGHLLRRVEDRVVAWAGEGPIRTPDGLAASVRTDSDHGDLTGSSSRVTLADGSSLEVFTGALVEALATAQDPDPEAASARRSEMRRSIVEGDDRGALSRRDRRNRRIHEDEDPERVASALSEDGLALRISVS